MYNEYMDKHEYNLKRQREYRKRNDNKCTRKYEKTPNGFLMRKYRNMQSRTKGIQWKKKHLYNGLELLDRQEFYNWAKNSNEFWDLFNKWVENDYDRKLCPTVNRIDSQVGYNLHNIEWLTHSENSRLGALSKHKMKI